MGFAFSRQSAATARGARAIARRRDGLDADRPALISGARSPDQMVAAMVVIPRARRSRGRGGACERPQITPPPYPQQIPEILIILLGVDATLPARRRGDSSRPCLVPAAPGFPCAVARAPRVSARPSRRSPCAFLRLLDADPGAPTALRRGELGLAGDRLLAERRNPLGLDPERRVAVDGLPASSRLRQLKPWGP